MAKLTANDKANIAANMAMAEWARAKIESLKIKSNNQPWSMTRKYKGTKKEWGTARDKYSNQNVNGSSFWELKYLAKRLKAGNCWEKANVIGWYAMRFRAAVGGQRKPKNPIASAKNLKEENLARYLYRVKWVGYDHVVCVISEKKLEYQVYPNQYDNLSSQDDQIEAASIKAGKAYTCDDLGKSGAVLDGWTEDWWFPNIGKMDSLKTGAWRAANIIQKGVRSKGLKAGQFVVQDGGFMDIMILRNKDGSRKGVLNKVIDPTLKDVQPNDVEVIEEIDDNLPEISRSRRLSIVCSIDGGRKSISRSDIEKALDNLQDDFDLDDQENPENSVKL